MHLIQNSQPLAGGCSWTQGLAVCPPNRHGFWLWLGALSLTQSYWESAFPGAGIASPGLALMPEKRWRTGSHLASPTSCRFPALRSTHCSDPETRYPTSHLFWQKQPEGQQRGACCRGATASSPCRGAGLHSGGPCAPLAGRVINRLQDCSRGRESEPGRQTCSAILSTQLPELGRGTPAASALASAGDSQGRGPAGSRSRNHGDGGGGWRRCGRLPAAGWEWFFPCPSHCRADLKGQPARLCLRSQQRRTTHLKTAP